MAITRPDDAGGTQATVAYELSNSGNARLLEHILSEHYHLVRSPRRDSAAPFDILIVDPGALESARAYIDDCRKRASPVIVPVLLIAASDQAPDAWIRRELGGTVDDVLRIPTSAIELTTRIDNLLRLRRLSRLQEETGQELRGVIRALNTLSTCDEIMVRANSEQELLSRICVSIAADDDYGLAWIGFVDDDADDSLPVHAYAGPAAAYIEQKPIRFRDGILADVLATGRTRIIDLIEEDPRVSENRRHLARRHGLASAIMLPLVTGSGPQGCLAIYSRQPDHFGHELRQLLERLAANLTFGLDALRVRKESSRQASEIRSLAYSDALTRLPNRQHFLERLSDRLACSADDGNTTGAILFIDLDLFKRVNDALGHYAGDQVLRTIGERLRRTMRGSDLVARQGGDEFVVAMFNYPRHQTGVAPAWDTTFEETVYDKAQQILRQLRDPIVIGEQEHRLGASIGVSLFPQHGRDAALLVERADIAMYEAKKQPDHHIHQFSQSILEQRQHRLSLEGRLYQAIRQDELALHYQPVVRLDTMKIVAVEALVRWPQTDGSLLSPAEFLPLAEETGMIVELGDWVLNRASSQLGHWHERGHDFRMMVNISIRQLHGSNDLRHLAEIVRHHVDPSSVELEVTESALMSDPPLIESRLAALNDQGFRFAIDDFGTGYSSLSRIKDLPFDTLKIDRMFVAGIGLPGKGETVTQTILQLAHNLSLETVAEGIEAPAQQERLLEWGCGCGQGFWFSHPIAPDAVTALLEPTAAGE